MCIVKEYSDLYNKRLYITIPYCYVALKKENLILNLWNKNELSFILKYF